MIKPFLSFKLNFNFDFFSLKSFAVIFSGILIILSIFITIKRDLNFGIDFIGGIMIDAKFSYIPDINDLRLKLGQINIGNFEIQEFGSPENILIKLEKQKGEEDKQLEAIKKVKEILPSDVDYRRIEFVGPKVGDELKAMGIKAVVFSLFAMFIYIWFRFSGWEFGIGALVALIHDVLTTIGFFAISQIEFNLSSIAAILTIAGYSVNDTVVVFDRVRENLRKSKSIDQLSIINKSLNETLGRTITTSLTTLLALFAIYFFGGEVISDFTLAMIWGVMIGTYSSIFVASAFLSFFNLRRTDTEEKEDLNYFNND